MAISVNAQRATGGNRGGGGGNRGGGGGARGGGGGGGRSSRARGPAPGLHAQTRGGGGNRGGGGGARGGGGGGGRTSSASGTARDYAPNGEVGDATITIDPDNRRAIIITDDETIGHVREVLKNLD